jgi:hypothetical protein
LYEVNIAQFGENYYVKFLMGASCIEVKLQRLLDGYLDQAIEQEIYRAEKSKLLFTKKSLEEKISSLLQKQNDWHEPMKEWVRDTHNLNGIARDNDLFAKKVVAKEIFGSNLLLVEKTVRTSLGGAPNSFGKMEGNQWDARSASHLLALKKPIRSVLVGDTGLEPVTFPV